LRLLSKIAEKSTLWINSLSILAQFYSQSREEKDLTTGDRLLVEFLPASVCLNHNFSAQEQRVRLSVKEVMRPRSIKAGARAVDGF
jgi:hypothetical protein